MYKQTAMLNGASGQEKAIYQKTPIPHISAHAIQMS